MPDGCLPLADPGGAPGVIGRTNLPFRHSGYAIPLQQPDMEKQIMRSDVLIVGAGPTGLVLALWLTKLGVNVRVVDKTAEPGTTSRALAVQARTLELYRQLGLADAVVDAGRKAVAVNLWVAGRQAARVPFETVGEGLTPCPFLLIFPQNEHEKRL